MARRRSRFNLNAFSLLIYRVIFLNNYNLSYRINILSYSTSLLSDKNLISSSKLTKDVFLTKAN